eukprot:TRINITY_DN38902_c0_g1_i1.p1 TRINITY_DN38902_c0_g1~~TRINITY_DN38902_c0_g1_i1.p1  ORF type:complete len:149 (+),score=10.67 TRINITY_DN38902_c0_g1_i1:77-523(+)
MLYQFVQNFCDDILISQIQCRKIEKIGPPVLIFVFGLVIFGNRERVPKSSTIFGRCINLYLIFTMIHYSRGFDDENYLNNWTSKFNQNQSSIVLLLMEKSEMGGVSKKDDDFFFMMYQFVSFFAMIHSCAFSDENHFKKGSAILIQIN